MEDRSVAIRVGIVVLVAIVLLVGGLLWITETQVRDRGYTIEVVFPSVSGLVIGDPVQVGGVKQGRVEAVSLRARDVLVSLWFPSGTQIRRDAKISIQDQGLMGQKFVAVSIGEASEAIRPGEIVEGETAAGIQEAMGQLAGVLDNLGRIVADFEAAMGDEDTRGRLRETLTNSAEVAKELNGLLKSARPGIESSVGDLAVSAREMRTLMTDNREKIGVAVDRAEGAFTRLDSMVTDLGATSRSLNVLVARIEAGEGTLGKLTADDKLYLDLRKTVKDLDALLLDMQANPKKYVRFSIF